MTSGWPFNTYDAYNIAAGVYAPPPPPPHAVHYVYYSENHWDLYCHLCPWSAGEVGNLSESRADELAAEHERSHAR